ncbi:unnamed protein product [Microthlaspi erraticum]|uniref:Prolamin-like domain-containing protein n=1 Tax=Microthlaspi erraticum TaxID=1685480 RepID=A0A6D2JHW4_9BRAS|nr:unnamed protein product [Microthlaspi erraticum]
MKPEQTKVVFFLVALMAAFIPRPSEAGAPLVYCSTTKIDRVPGCFSALKVAVLQRIYKQLTVQCCRAVYATLPETCFLKVIDGLSLPMINFRTVCTMVPPAAAGPN